MGASSSAHTSEVVDSGFGQPEPWDSVVSLGPLSMHFWFQLPKQESLPTYSPLLSTQTSGMWYRGQRVRNGGFGRTNLGINPSPYCFPSTMNQFLRLTKAALAVNELGCPLHNHLLVSMSVGSLIPAPASFTASPGRRKVVLVAMLIS